jgi:hypothetical protein
MPVLPRVVVWYRAVWETPAPIAAGVCRIVLAITFILFLTVNLPADFRTWTVNRGIDHYRPVGVLNLYGSGGPPVGALVAAHWAAKVGVGFLLVGLFTRLSLAVVTVAMWHVCGAAYAYSSAISHTFIPALVAGFGLLAGARSPLSIDYLLARGRRLEFWATPRAGVALVIFAVGWSFANAALHKAYLGNHRPFVWCASDNLRNLILFQHLKLRAPLPPALEWVLARPWAYKTMAWSNVACQFLPVAGAFLVRKPWTRLVLAGLVLAELLGLGFVMGMWHGYGDIWLLLALVFIDWDAVFHRVTRRPFPEPADRGWWARRAWAVVLCAVFVIGSCQSKPVRAAYPFLPFDMFSYLLVAEPYTEHRPFPVVLTTWEVESSPPLDAKQKLDVWKRYHGGRGTPAAAAEQVRHYCESEYGVRVDAVRGTKQCFVLPPPPTPAAVPGPAGLWVSWPRETGSARTLAATTGPPGPRRLVRLAPVGFEPTDVRFEYVTLDSPAANSVVAVHQGKWEYELQFPPEARGFVFVTARVKDATGAEETYYVTHFRVPD